MVGPALLAALFAVCGVWATFLLVGPLAFAIVSGVVLFVARARGRTGVDRDDDDQVDWATALVLGGLVLADVAFAVHVSTHHVSRVLALVPSLTVGVLSGAPAGALAVRQLRAGFAGLPGTFLSVPTSLAAAVGAFVATLLSTM